MSEEKEQKPAPRRKLYQKKGVKIGRPTKYTPELADLICERIAKNPESIPKICKKYDDMPSHESIYLWIYKHQDFADKYVAAKQSQAKIAMEGIDDLYDSVNTFNDKDGNTKYDAAHVTHINNIANHRKWMAARLARKTYGREAELESVKSKNEELQRQIDDLMNNIDRDNEKDY